jgi:hypothetical protein
MIWLTSMPPVEYDKPFVGRLLLQRFSDRAKLPCSRVPYQKLACALPTPDRSWCYIAIATDKLLATENHVYASVLRHELGHCNGWGKDHERERRVPRDRVRAPALPKETQLLTLDDLTSICVRADASLTGCEPDDKWSVCETLSADGKFQVCKHPAVVAANPPTMANPPPANPPPVKPAPYFDEGVCNARLCYRREWR